MSKKEMEKNLEYGDCFNFFGSLLGSILAVVGIEEEKLDKNNKNN